jgi:hypothetical protein
MKLGTSFDRTLEITSSYNTVEILGSIYDYDATYMVRSQNVSRNRYLDSSEDCVNDAGPEESWNRLIGIYLGNYRHHVKDLIRNQMILKRYLGGGYTHPCNHVIRWQIKVLLAI